MSDTKKPTWEEREFTRQEQEAKKGDVKETLTKAETKKMEAAHEDIIKTISLLKGEIIGGPKQTTSEKDFEGIIARLKKAITECNRKFIIKSKPEQKEVRVEFAHSAAGVPFKWYREIDHRYETVDLGFQRQSPTNEISISSSNPQLNWFIFNLDTKN